jgi:hypothetical protein
MDKKIVAFFLAPQMLWRFQITLFGSRSFIPLHVIFAIEVFWNNEQTYFKDAQHGFIGLIKHSDRSLG